MLTRQSRVGLSVILLSLCVLQARAEILWEYWTGIPGNRIADLENHPNYPDHPTGSDYLSSFEAPTDWAEAYGSRVRGYLIAPATGAYTFWLASDDNGQLWLSTDDDPANVELIAFVSDWTSSRQWNRYASQKSVPIQLVAGERYYIEALQKEGDGGDNLAVGWTTPGQSTSAPSEVIPGWVLLPWTGYDPTYNRAPATRVRADRSIEEAPVALKLFAEVRDDGKPLPANPEDPNPTDPNKLRWSWSVVSAPVASGGVVWFDGPTAGEAFTYDGSEYLPDTVFVCDPCALFDAPGLYVLEFHASDGDKETVRQVNVSIRSTGIYRQLGYMYLSPVPFAEYTPTGTEYILVRFNDITPDQVSNLATFITVEGADSGLHSGQTHVAADGRTVRFEMSKSFSPNERVTVTLNPKLKAGVAEVVEPYQYQFMVNAHFPDPDRITARGEVPPLGAKENAFDGDIGTEWVDWVTPDGASQSSWIQRVFAGVDETHAVDQYTLTAAGDAPERDPRDWLFYGVDEDGGLTLLDVQTDQTFSGRGQQKTYAIDNVVAYRGYRLEIASVNDPAHATGVQLAELSWRERVALLREYWLGIGGNPISNLTNHPDYPDHPSGRDHLTRFEAPSNWADAYGTRVRGFLTAPTTGSYVFWIASDDDGQLWLSADDDPAHSELIASVSGWTGAQEWGKYGSQRSAPITLTAGTRYYIEALQKEGSGGDNLAVGWARPGQSTAGPSEIIPGEVLSAWQVEESMSLESLGFAEPVEAGQQTVGMAQVIQADADGARITGTGVSIPSDFPEVAVTINRNPAPGYIFISYPHNNSGRQRYVMILDNNGDPVWYTRGGAEAWNEFKIQDNGTITMDIFNGYDYNFNWIKRYQARNGHVINHHDLEVLADGGYLMIADHQLRVDASRLVAGGNPNASVTQTILQEYTAADELIFQFRAWDNYNVADMNLENNLAASFRFPHINAIDVDDDGHIVISCRHLSEITKINRDTGQVIWRLGGAQNDFTYVDDPLNGFWNQHDITALGNNRYLLFDNGNGHSPAVSRAVEYELDLETMTAKMVWQYRDTPDKYTHYMGNAQRLPNGNTLINFVLAQYPKAIEVDRQGVKQFEMSILPGSDLYRVFRFPWNGVVPKPYLIAETSESDVTLVFNKFNDPNVAAYRIYGGTSPQPTTLLMETSSTLAHLTELQNHKQHYFRVTAVSDSGSESPYSNEESLFVDFLGQPGVELIRNGDFSQGQNEWAWSTAGAQAEWSVSNGVCSIAIANAGTRFDAIALQQAGLPLVQGREYTLEFDLRSTATRVLEIEVKQKESPYTNYSRIGYTAASVQNKHYSFDFTMNSATDTDARLVINAGLFDADLYIDNISLMQK